MATTTVIASSAQAFYKSSTDFSWAGARGATDYTGITSVVGAWPSGADFQYYVARLPMHFTLPAFTAIASATLSVYVVTKDSAGANQSFGLTGGTQVLPVSSDDFNDFLTTELCTRVNYSTFTAGAYVAFPLNASGLAYLTTTSQLWLRHYYDLVNTAPGFAQIDYFTFGTTSGQQPKLDIDYTPVPAGGGGGPRRDTQLVPLYSFPSNPL